MKLLMKVLAVLMFALSAMPISGLGEYRLNVISAGLALMMLSEMV